MKYFKHDLEARENKRLWKLIKIHGMTGYGVWWAILEELYKSEEKQFQIAADSLWLERFADSLRLADERVLIRIIDSLAELGLLNAQLWHENVLYCDAVIERGDSYIKQKANATERKKRQREKSQKVTRVSRVTNEMSRVTDLDNVTNAKSHAGVTTNTDPDPDPDPDTDPKQREKERGLVQEEVQNSLSPSLPRDPFTERMNAGGCPYPALVRAGLKDLWIGPGRNDFAPGVVQGAIAFLKKHDLPHEVGDAKNCIRNKVQREDWGWLELLVEAGSAGDSSQGISPTDPAYDWSKDPRYSKWLAEYRSQPLTQFLYPNGAKTSDLERDRFAQWADSHVEVA